MNREYMKETWVKVIQEIHANHLEHPTTNVHMQGLIPAPTRRQWVDNHPRAQRWSMVKFMPVSGALRNHGMGMDLWDGKGCFLRAWRHGKGTVEITFSVDPEEREFEHAVRFLGLWTGFAI